MALLNGVGSLGKKCLGSWGSFWGVGCDPLPVAHTGMWTVKSYKSLCFGVVHYFCVLLQETQMFALMEIPG